MQLWSKLKFLARNLVRRQQLESQLDEELRSYADMLADEKIAAGIPASEARRTTLADLGGIEQVNNAVTQMDKVTQQNAALVEEAAAAAKSMEERLKTPHGRADSVMRNYLGQISKGCAAAI